MSLNGSAHITSDVVELHARHANIAIVTDATAKCRCGGGSSNASIDINYNRPSAINAGSGVVIRTTSLLVSLDQSYSRSRSRSRGGGLFVSEGGSASLTNNSTRTSSWNATVELLGTMDPLFIVDENGVVVAKSTSVTAYAGSTLLSAGDQIGPSDVINIDPIFYTGTPKVLFRAGNAPYSGPASSIAGTSGKFIVQHTWATATIVNMSDHDMVMRGSPSGPSSLSIDTLNRTIGTSPQAVINISFDNGPNPASGGAFQFDVSHNFAATDVKVLSARGPPNDLGHDLTFNGGISNIIGSTTIGNDRGDVLFTDDYNFTSNQLHLDSGRGSVGTLARPLNAVMVQSDYVGGTRPIRLDGTVYDDVFLTLTNVRRGTSLLGSVILPLIGPLNAGGRIDIVVLDSIEGNGTISVPSLRVDVYSPTNCPTSGLFPPFTGGSPCGGGGATQVPTTNHFRPDDPGGAVVDSIVLTAFGSGASTINTDIRFTNFATTAGFNEILDASDAGLTKAGLRAGGDIDVRHTGGSTVNMVLDLAINVTNTRADTDGQSRVYLDTNGFIRAFATTQTLVVGVIESHNRFVELTSIDAAYEIFHPDFASTVKAAEYIHELSEGDVHVGPAATGTATSQRIDIDANGGIVVDPGAHLKALTVIDLVAGMDGTGSILVNDAWLEAGTDILFDAANNITVQNTADLDAGDDIEFDAGTGTASSGSIVIENQSTLDAGNSIDFDAANNITVRNDSTLTAGDYIRFAAGTGTANSGSIVIENMSALKAGISIYFDASNDITIRNTSTLLATQGIKLDAGTANVFGSITIESFSTLTANGILSPDPDPDPFPDPDPTLDPADNDGIFATAYTDVVIQTNAVVTAVRDITFTAIKRHVLLGNAFSVATVTSTGGEITFRAGQDIYTWPDATITALKGRILFYGDFLDETPVLTGDPLKGSIIYFDESIFEAPLILVFGNNHDDTIIFDETRLRGRTRAHGSNTPTPASTVGNDQYAPGSDGNDTFRVIKLPTMVGIENGVTLTLDGQTGSNTFDIYTAGSQSVTDYNYVINVLGTGAPDTGVQTLNIYGADNPSQNGIDPLTGLPYATDDIFLLRSATSIGFESGDAPVDLSGHQEQPHELRARRRPAMPVG